MGHREQLIEGAKRCLAEKGYLRTTARDIVAASGTNLASIGYHFGSKEALLTEAMVETMGEWGDEVERVLAQTNESNPLNRLETMVNGIIESFNTQRGIWLASFEIGTMTEQRAELRAQLAAANEAGRIGLASIFLGVRPEEIDEQTARTVGSLLLAFIPGLCSQVMVDPASAPDGRAIAEGLLRMVEMVRPSEAQLGAARGSAASRD